GSPEAQARRQHSRVPACHGLSPDGKPRPRREIDVHRPEGGFRPGGGAGSPPGGGQSHPPGFAVRPTIPAPPPITTNRSPGTFKADSRLPLGQRISRSAVVAPPRPKCRRRSFAE